VTVSQLKIRLEPRHDIARLDPFPELAVLGEALRFGKFPKVIGALASLLLDIVEISLDRHVTSPSMTYCGARTHLPARERAT
jgi:hypothetical protein